MSQLCDRIECYLLENNFGSPKAGYCQKLHCIPTLFIYFFSLARQNIMLGVCLTHNQEHV